MRQTPTGAARAMSKAEAGSVVAQAEAWISATPEATVNELRRMRRAVSTLLRAAAPRDVLRAALRLSQAPRPGSRFVAYELVKHHPLAPALLDGRQLERLGRGMDSWDKVDCFSICLSGPAWQRGVLPTRVVHGWALSPDRWWRRAALVSTVPLNSRAHGGTGDSRRTLRVCRMLERDRDPMITKALSWALRELSKGDPAAVRAFLSERAGALAPLVLREVRNKLVTGLKNPRRRLPR